MLTLEDKIRGFEEFCMGYDLYFYYIEGGLYGLHYNDYRIYCNLETENASCHLLGYEVKKFKGEQFMNDLLDHIAFPF